MIMPMPGLSSTINYNYCLRNSSFSKKIIKWRSSLPLPPLPLKKYWCFFSYKNIWSDSSSSSSSTTAATTNATCSTHVSPLSGGIAAAAGVEDVMLGYIFGKKKATQVAHLLWKHIVRKGDLAIDATCGNDHDTLALLKLVADATQRGRVYAMDVQKLALESTSLLLNQSLSPEERDHVELFLMCHSKMEEVIPSGIAVRLVAFNLGYLPGGEKAVITRSETTLLALEAARRILASGGLISIVVYVGHAGGREELETVQGFASELPVEEWVCCKLQTLNRPLAPIMVLLFRR